MRIYDINYKTVNGRRGTSYKRVLIPEDKIIRVEKDSSVLSCEASEEEQITNNGTSVKYTDLQSVATHSNSGDGTALTVFGELLKVVAYKVSENTYDTPKNFYLNIKKILFIKANYENSSVIGSIITYSNSVFTKEFYYTESTLDELLSIFEDIPGSSGGGGSDTDVFIFISEGSDTITLPTGKEILLVTTDTGVRVPADYTYDDETGEMTSSSFEDDGTVIQVIFKNQ